MAAPTQVAVQGRGLSVLEVLLTLLRVGQHYWRGIRDESKSNHTGFFSLQCQLTDHDNTPTGHTICFPRFAFIFFLNVLAFIGLVHAAVFALHWTGFVGPAVLFRSGG